MTDFCGFTPKNRFFLAPMAGITDAAFRTVCAEQGAAVTYTEMVSARALVYEDKKTASLLEMQAEQRPCGAQLFGNEPEIMAEAAVRAAAICKPEFLDVNMGCPMPKIFNNGDGSALMGDPERAAAIVTAMKKAVDLPVTVKFRSGIREEARNCVEFAKRMEAAGADAMCVHGRTRVQMYSGTSDRSMVKAVKDAVSVPVIASGDALSGQDCMDILAETGADFIMIARGAEGYPMIFRDCLALEAGLPKPEHSAAEVLEVMRRHARLTCELKAEHRAMPELRKHMLWYLGNLRGAKSYKPRMAQINTLEEFLTLCEELEQQQFDVKG
ncbi:MAG: tRNA dihydrouridine synthase DusB [Clostridia bacterium]|nr:tRNA dihydrouridine synthase DusB [Clostridia bacterium]